MKSIIQKSLAIALVYYAVAVIGCEKKCPTFKIEKFQYSKIDASNLQYKFQKDTAFQTNLNTVDTIDRLEYGIRLTFNYDLVVSTNSKTSFELMNSAYAVYKPCPTDERFSIDTIKKFSIVTLNDFDSANPKGTDMSNGYFAILNTYEGKVIYNQIFYDPKRFMIEQPSTSGTEDYDVYFINKNRVSNLVSFELKIEYTNGKIITAKTKPVFLK